MQIKREIQLCVISTTLIGNIKVINYVAKSSMYTESMTGPRIEPSHYDYRWKNMDISVKYEFQTLTAPIFRQNCPLNIS